MASPEGELFAKFLKCELCNTDFKDPKLLDCLHTFCEKCIAKSNTESAGQHVVCPKCQLSTDTRHGLTDNHFLSALSTLSGIKNLAKKSPQAVKCHDCILGDDKQSAVCICVVCLQPMCNVDKNAHVKHFADHSYISIQDLSAKNLLEIISKNIFCSRHPHQVGAAICTDCNQILCQQECIVSHQECKVSREFQTILAENKQNLNSLMFKSVDIIAEIKSTIQLHGKRKRDAERSLQLLEATIDMEFSYIFKVLQDRKLEMLSKAKQEYQPTIDEIVEESKVLFRKMKALSDANQFCQLVIDSNYSPSLPYVSKCYTELANFSNIPDYGFIPEYKFCVDRTLRTTVSCLGKLTHVRGVSPSVSSKILPLVDNPMKPLAIAFDGIDKLYVFDKQEDMIKVLTEKLEILTEYNVQFGVGQVSLSASKNYLFVCLHEENIVKVFTTEGVLFCDLEGGTAGEKHLFDFTDNFAGMVCGKDGHVLIADSGNNRVQVFTPELKFSHFIGELFEAGALRRPVDVSVNSQSQVAVLHWANPCINLYTLKGVILSQFGTLLGSIELSLPVKLSFLTSDKLIVLDYKSQNLSMYSADRQFLTRYENILPLSVNNIPSLAPGNQGNLYFCEPSSGQIMLYNKFVFL
ncbi:hypothetical protein LOD99_13505 [Oopsacas minuta]|uniref:RING-type domain-containing protein n=1 Tax=Oopsacas minuta TaxID=111878 RepID=A0AAV7KJM7_9METZ|nr:hypothetical protein LOD99_13505 [Oopsacas minuta]